ncbi:MAG: ATP synthase F1 subunit gamma [Acidobacteriota bacterium]
MPNLKDLRRRVKAVQSTRQITKAMKMVSSAKLRRAKDRVVAARPYADKMTKIFADLNLRAPEYRHSLLAVPAVEGETPGRERLLLLLITGDKGLCGGFNTNLIKAARDFLRQHEKDEVELAIVGRKGTDFFRRRPVTIKRQYLNITASGLVNTADAKRIAEEVTADFVSTENKFDRVFLLYSVFKSALSSIPTTSQLLPVGRSGGEETAASEALVDYVYEQPPDQVFSTLLPNLIFTRVYRALLESVASETGARMTAMEAATKNADDVISKLTLTMNRVRQAAITREIIEVVSGAEAL